MLFNKRKENCEFVENNNFINAKDVYEKYIVYMYFYHNIRPQGSLKNETPAKVHNDYYSFSQSNHNEAFILSEYKVKVKRG